MALDNFFEVKKAKLRLNPRSATSPTLATPSQCVNGDAGMIACNYDGTQKHCKRQDVESDPVICSPKMRRPIR
jgi:bifunctional N-acetylglucosamine-1-phosphate-uridyltransferase/glucosamine-1-phosphate-acetyltransferase GlmU-like protein